VKLNMDYARCRRVDQSGGLDRFEGLRDSEPEQNELQLVRKIYFVSA
jgi:hypothetical protein